MDHRAARTQITAALKAAGFKPRRGRLRREAGELWWYVDVVAASPSAPLIFEVGCWPPAVRASEPEGGAADCPLLFETELAGDPKEAAEALAQRLAQVDCLQKLADGLASGDLPKHLIDADLRGALEA